MHERARVQHVLDHVEGGDDVVRPAGVALDGRDTRGEAFAASAIDGRSRQVDPVSV
jgi:hypothetical protein